MLKIYSDKFSNTGPDLRQIASTTTLLEWFYADGLPEHAKLDQLPISVFVEGVRMLHYDWPTCIINENSDVEIYREPKGTDPFSITFGLILGAKAVLKALTPKIPSINSGSGRGQGDGLDEASAKGNKVKTNDTIPELAGFNRRYPDYLTLTRRWFQSPREQWIEMLLCVGKGEYDIPLSTCKVGETPLLSLGADARFNLYGPGASVAAEPAHMVWYTSPEVSSTSSGASGLELTVTSAITIAATASAFSFNSENITTVGGTWPTDWTDGLLLVVAAPYPYTISDGGGDDSRDIISGDIAQLGFVSGDTIEIRGDNEGRYIVHSATGTQLQLNYENGAPGVGLQTGNVTMAIGWRGLRYRVVAIGTDILAVERLRSNGTTDTTWPGWTSNTSNLARVQIDNSNLEGGYRGIFPAAPTGALVTEIEYDVFYPGGLVRYNGNGDPVNITVVHTFEWRDIDTAGPWNSVVNSNVANSLDSRGYTYRVVLPYAMRPECRMKREPSQEPDSNKRSDTILWYALKGLIPAASKAVFEGVTTMAVYVRGGDRISSQSEALINVECTRKLQVLNGMGKFGADLVATRQISAWVRYIALSVGYTDADINLNRLQALEEIWTSRKDTYDQIITSIETVKAYMIECLNAGFSELTINRGQITPVRDQLRAVGEYDSVYNPQDMASVLSKDFTSPTPDDFDGVDVQYRDSKTWVDATVKCRLPGDLGVRVDSITIEGVTDRDKAYQHGMRKRLQHKYKRWNYSFSTELDALNSNYLDLSILGDTVPGYGQSAFMTDIRPDGAGWQLASSEPLDWSWSGEHLVAIRRRDGSASGPYTATRIDDYWVHIDALDFTPDLSGVWEPPFIQFGPIDTWCYPALIEEVSPSGTKTCKVTATNYDPRVYAYDDRLADN